MLFCLRCHPLPLSGLAFLGVYTAVAMSRGSQAGSPAWLSAAALVALSVFLVGVRGAAGERVCSRPAERAVLGSVYAVLSA